MVHVHRMFFHYSEYPPSLRVLFSGALIVLGIAYIFAMVHTFVSHAGRDGEPGLSVQDLVIAYNGTRADSRLEAALKGPMSGMITPDDLSTIVNWVHNGAAEEEFEPTIQPILENRCVMCHNPDNPHIPNLTDQSVVMGLTEVDTGVSVYSLIRVSHIHLFGMTFIFFVVGFIFSHALVRPAWLKCIAIGVPFLAIVLDIGSWYLTKLWPPFAWIVYLGGVAMALSFAFMWITSMYQMWFMKPPENMERDLETWEDIKNQ